MAAFLSRARPSTTPQEAAASTVTPGADQGATQASDSAQEQSQAKQELWHVQERQPQQELPVPQQGQRFEAPQKKAGPLQAQDQQKQRSETYASQLSAAIAASLADAGGLPPDPQSAAQPEDGPASRAINRVPVRTDSYLDLLNHGQYRAWAAIISQAGQSSGGGGGAEAATAWQVVFSSRLTPLATCRSVRCVPQFRFVAG